jgi:hypothetical protein
MIQGTRFTTMPAPVSHSRPIAASAGAVWQLMAAPGNLEECHPFCAANPVERWPGVGSQDRVEYYNGRVITRRFAAWQEGVGYDLETTDGGGPVATVSWRLSARGGGSVLTIAISPQMLGGVPRMVRPIPERAVVRPMLVRYLRAVLQGIEWRVTTGEPVRRNQFGSHRWFSARTGVPGGRA